MTPIGPKQVRLRLDAVAYESLRQQVPRRDGWRCQSCGTMSNLEVHHREFRSHSRADAEENLITLCTACHARMHRRLATNGYWLTYPPAREAESTVVSLAEDIAVVKPNAKQLARIDPILVTDALINSSLLKPSQAMIC